MSDGPAAPAGPAAPDVTLFFGPMLLGVLINTLLYGTMLIQAYAYYVRYKGDRPWFRFLVLYLVIMETVNWVCDVGLIYEPLIVRYGTPQALIVSPVMLRLDALVTVLVSTPIQLFMAWRNHVVSRGRIFPAIIVVLAIVSFGGGIAVSAIVILHPNFGDLPDLHAQVAAAWLISTAVCDVLLAGSLVYSLWTRKTHIPSTDSYINKVIRMAVQTGSITAAAAVLDIVFTRVLPHTTMFVRSPPYLPADHGLIASASFRNFIVDLPLSELYTNSLLSTLNARPWRELAPAKDVPNALFEQTPPPQSQNSFVLSDRRPMPPTKEFSSAASKYTMDSDRSPRF
ncbi:hypothetical protein C8R46DRAFT_1236132 [Mycena filopes]|nr:hypothetical protein C8R46DRAFT_1236132 [Mycena filopes]